MGFFRKERKKTSTDKPIWAIKKSVLELVYESAKSIHPNEFASTLRATDGVINEVALLPGTTSGNRHAILRLNMLPIDYSVVGTVHSHPSFSSRPSNADLHLFQKHGKVHIIAAKPYAKDSWRAYNYNGEEIEMDVI